MSLLHSVPIHHDPVRSEHSLEVEVDQGILVLLRLLDADHCSVHVALGGDARLPIVSYQGMHDGGVHEDDGFLEPATMKSIR